MPKRKILLIEDEKDLIKMYQKKLEQAGFEVIWAMEAREGLRMAKIEKPDVIMLDILLPRESGVFFLEEMEKDIEIASIPVFAFSNYDDPLTKKRALELGAKDYLIKTNHTPQQVLKKIESYLKTNRSN